MDIASKRLNIVLFGFFVVMAFCEYIFFRHYVLLNIVDHYPVAFDQVSYLSMTYLIYANVQKYGVFFGFLKSPVLVTGFLFPIQAVLYFLVFGANRLNALTVNFIYFILMQAYVFYVAKKNTDNFILPVLMLALTLWFFTPLRLVGGMVDFRIDFVALCLYGIFVSAVIDSNIFYSFKGSLLISFIAIWLFLTRYITGVYIILASACLFGYYILLWFFAKRSSNFYNCKLQQKRLKNIFLFLLIVFAGFILYTWINWKTLTGYYWVGHVAGQEAHIRKVMEGYHSFIGNMLFYSKRILKDHLKFPFVVIMGFIFSFYFLVSSFLKQSFNKICDQRILRFFSDKMVFLLLFMAVPYSILTMDSSKNSVVIAIITIPFFWIIGLLFFRLIAKYMFDNNVKKITITFCLLLLITGLMHYTFHFVHKKNIAVKSDPVFQMYLDIGNYAQKINLHRVVLSMDRIDERIRDGNLVLSYFERYKKYLLVDNTDLGGGSLSAIDKHQAKSALLRSDVLIFSKNKKPDKVDFPFNESVYGMRSYLNNLIKKNFNLFKTYVFNGDVFNVYVKKRKGIKNV